MKTLYRYLANYKNLVFLALLLAAVNQIFSLLDPWIFRKIIDNYVTHPERYSSDEFLKGAGMLILAAMGAAFISRVAKNFQDYYVNSITQRLGAQIYADGLKHSLELPYQVFEDQRSGETLGKLQKVRVDTERLISAFVNIMFTSLVGITFVTIYSIQVYPLIAPVYFSMIPLLAILSSVLSKRVKKIQKVIVAETTALAGSTTESLRNIELVKSLGLANQEITRLNSTTDKILQLELKKVKYIRSLSFIQGTFVNLMRNCLLFFMMYLVFMEKITVGEFFSLFIYSFFIFGPLQEMGNIINIYREAEVSLQNFDEIMKMEKEPAPVNPTPLGEIKKLEFRNVSFKHQTAANNAISNINFNTGLGETIAFVGPSGSGKTTLVKMLVGLYRPLQGEVLYNNLRYDEVRLDELRNQIGFVTQDTQLFSGTIRENLLFVNPGATDAQCIDVLNKAACQSLLARADKGLDTMIGEGGVKVSGGEKQRLSIARALLRQPTMMVFDEATSALDSLTEEEINETIRNLSGDRNHITILIAHRLSTIMHADCIYVLEKGQIIEKGRHQDLLDLKGLYYAMWRQQIGERNRSEVAPMLH
ncbi:MAG: putative multidrug resistance ABC transporter ATP-binding/permease protein YheI [Bacteroidetes bacterium ADurb.Bin397]|jgi:ATP-binding cassette, subfamily B, bacterial|nr:ABC transporter ATP-binding protein [Bacteroidia bacterium]OQA08097.1 MAG: putative multidrug resistance ABC transporter ATP-binding/permease protein YheI [Bacteroidetes bacterium ADurb.Bin397]